MIPLVVDNDAGRLWFRNQNFSLLRLLSASSIFELFSNKFVLQQFTLRGEIIVYPPLQQYRRIDK